MNLAHLTLRQLAVQRKKWSRIKIKEGYNDEAQKRAFLAIDAEILRRTRPKGIPA